MEQVIGDRDRVKLLAALEEAVALAKTLEEDELGCPLEVVATVAGQVVEATYSNTGQSGYAPYSVLEAAAALEWLLTTGFPAAFRSACNSVAIEATLDRGRIALEFDLGAYNDRVSQDQGAAADPVGGAMIGHTGTAARPMGRATVIVCGMEMEWSDAARGFYRRLRTRCEDDVVLDPDGDDHMVQRFTASVLVARWSDRHGWRLTLERWPGSTRYWRRPYGAKNWGYSVQSSYEDALVRAGRM